MVILRRIAIGLFFGGLLAGAQACRGATEITFTITTDLDCSAVKDTSFAVGDLTGIDTRPASTTSTQCDPATHRLGSVVVIPSGSNGADVAVRVITGVSISADQCLTNKFVGGCVVARRELHFLPHTPLDVPIKIESACRDVPCSPSQTCLAGVCVSSTATCNDTTCDLPQGTATGLPIQWKPMADKPAELAPRAEHTAVWTGTEMIVWGGSGPGYFGDGGAYNPTTDTWRYIPTSLVSPRIDHVAVWSGTEMIIWGGVVSTNDSASITGGRYDPGGTWRVTSPPPQSFVGRSGHAAAWFAPTSEMIIFGGRAAAGNQLNDGAAYNPTTDTWRILATSQLNPREQAGMVVANGKVVVFGGYGTNVNDYAEYDPANDSWSVPVTPSIPERIPSVSVSDGTNAFFWGGSRVNNPPQYGSGLVVVPGKPEVLISEAPTSILALSGRDHAVGWAAQNQFWIWGGEQTTTDAGAPLLNDGAQYDLTKQAWVAAIPSTGAPSARERATAVWTGTEAIVWGGDSATGAAAVQSDYLGDGAIFGP
jgi:N-acetylneuraminic acid mutarotase